MRTTGRSGGAKAHSPRDWSYVVEDQDADLDDVTDNSWEGNVEHHGLIVDRVVVFSPFPPNKIVKGMPKQRQIIDPLRDPATPEQRAAREDAKRRREHDAAWQRLRGHPNRSLMRAIETLQRLAQQPDLKVDLQRVLWEIVRPPDADALSFGDVDEDEIIAGFLDPQNKSF